MSLFSLYTENKTAFMIVLIVAVSIRIATYLLRGTALLRLSKAEGFKNGYLAFVPFVSPFVLGKLSENEKKRDKLLLILSLLKAVLLVAFSGTGYYSAKTILSFAEKCAEKGTSMELSMFYSVIPALLIFIILAVVSVLFAVYYFISLYNVYKKADEKRTVIWLILSFLPLLAPIILFVLSFKNYEQ